MTQPEKNSKFISNMNRNAFKWMFHTYDIPGKSFKEDYEMLATEARKELINASLSKEVFDLLIQYTYYVEIYARRLVSYLVDHPILVEDFNKFITQPMLNNFILTPDTIRELKEIVVNNSSIVVDFKFDVEHLHHFNRNNYLTPILKALKYVVKELCRSGCTFMHINLVRESIKEGRFMGIVINSDGKLPEYINPRLKDDLYEYVQSIYVDGDDILKRDIASRHSGDIYFIIPKW